MLVSLSGAESTRFYPLGSSSGGSICTAQAQSCPIASNRSKGCVEWGPEARPDPAADVGVIGEQVVEIMVDDGATDFEVCGQGE
jgi:hypothetical protein